MDPKLEQEILSSLIVMADKLDAKDEIDGVFVIDDVIKSAAKGRPRAPMKGLDDDVKEDLVKFLFNITKRMVASKKDLTELFRRMRYFDVADSAKPLGLDKALKNMSLVQDCADNSAEALHSMLGGNKASFKSLLEKLNGGDGCEDIDLDEVDHKPLDFFNSREETDEPTEPSELDEPAEQDEKIEVDGDMVDEIEELIEEDDELSDEDKEELEEFWNEFENSQGAE